MCVLFEYGGLWRCCCGDFRLGIVEYIIVDGLEWWEFLEYGRWWIFSCNELVIGWFLYCDYFEWFVRF